MCTVFTDSNVLEVFSGIEEPYLEYILESLVFCICLIRTLTSFGDITVCTWKRALLSSILENLCFVLKFCARTTQMYFNYHSLLGNLTSQSDDEKDSKKLLCTLIQFSLVFVLKFSKALN